MIPGQRYWLLLWYGVLILGLLGFGAAVYWGKRTHWKNLDEIFRGIGTVSVSAGMILLLHRVWISAGQLLLVTALAWFVLAFIFGRRTERPRPPQ
jgi:hypothetical protein